MKKETQDFIDNILFGATVIAGFGAVIGLGVKAMKDSRQYEAERIQEAKKHNKEIADELNSKKEFSTIDLIRSILSSDWINSNIKSILVKSVKTGRNKLSDEDNKQLYRVANNELINDVDKHVIFDQICDGHVKTKEELESETRINEAYYKYLTEKNKEASRIKQFEIAQENSLKRNKSFYDAIKSISTGRNSDNK